MTKEQEELRGHISDGKAATDHILEAVRRQLEDDKMKQNPTANALVGRISQSLTAQSGSLQSQLERFGAPSTHPVKEAFSMITGAMAGLYDKVRPQSLSRMLRDDYTALSLAVVSNSMLHTTALAFGDQSAADVALSNMKQLSEFIIELGEAVLPAVEKELSEQFQVQTGASQTALTNVRRVWNKDGAAK